MSRLAQEIKAQLTNNVKAKQMRRATVDVQEMPRQIREQFPHAYEADKATVSGDQNKETATVACTLLRAIENYY